MMCAKSPGKAPGNAPTSIGGVALLDRLPPTSPRVMRALAIAAVIAQAGIAVTGSVVRLTGSGLGCPTWPQCFPGSLVPVAHPETRALTQWIEFGNRLLTVVLVLVAARVPARRARRAAAPAGSRGWRSPSPSVWSPRLSSAG